MGKMIGRILHNKWASWLIPIMVAVSLNLGLISGWENGIAALELPIIFLSTLQKTSIVTDLLVGVASAALVFFALAQLSYSSRTLSTSLVTKYIIQNDVTYSYIFCQLSIIGVLSFLSIREQVYNLNIILSLFYLNCSIWISIGYFRWLANLFKGYKIYDIMVETIDLDKVVEHERKQKKGIAAVRERYKNPNVSFVFLGSVSDSYRMFSEVNSRKEGTISSINIAYLTNLITELRRHYPEVRIKINKNVGSLVKSPRKTNSPYNTLLCSLYIPKTFDKSNEDDLKRMWDKREPKIRLAFEVETHDPMSQAREVISDLHYLQSNIAKEEPFALEQLQRNYSEFYFKLHKYSISLGNDNDVINQLITSILREHIDSISQTNAQEQLKSYLPPLYPLVEIAISSQSVEVFRQIMSLMTSLFYRMLINSTSYSPTLATVGLYYSEIGSFKPHHYLSHLKERNIDHAGYEKFLDEATGITIRQMTLFISYLIRYSYHRPNNEIDKYLQEMLAQYVKVLDRFYREQHLDHLTQKHSENLKVKLCTCALLLFKAIEDGLFPRKQFSTVVRLLNSTNFVNPRLHEPEALDPILNTLLHDWEFHTRDFDSREWFELSKLRGTGYYSQLKFWVCVSIFRHKHHSNEFLPVSIGGQGNMVLFGSSPVLTALLTYIDSSSDYEQIAEICMMSISEIKIELQLYKEHLENIVSKNDDEAKRLIASRS